VRSGRGIPTATGAARRSAIGQPPRRPDPTVKAQLTAQAAQEQGAADTLFKGEKRKGLLNEAYAFSVFGQIAFYATIGLGLAALVVLGALAFAIVDARRSREVEPRA
jgi:hypothetical protein